MADKKNVVVNTAEYFKRQNVVLPKISELINPHTIDEDIKRKLRLVDKDAADPLNLFRVH